MTFKDCHVCGALMTVCDTKHRDGRVARYCPVCDEVRYPEITWSDHSSGHMGIEDAPEYSK